MTIKRYVLRKGSVTQSYHFKSTTKFNKRYKKIVRKVRGAKLYTAKIFVDKKGRKHYVYKNRRTKKKIKKKIIGLGEETNVKVIFSIYYEYSPAAGLKNDAISLDIAASIIYTPAEYKKVNNIEALMESYVRANLKLQRKFGIIKILELIPDDELKKGLSIEQTNEKRRDFHFDRLIISHSDKKIDRDKNER